MIVISFCPTRVISSVIPSLSVSLILAVFADPPASPVKSYVFGVNPPVAGKSDQNILLPSVFRNLLVCDPTAGASPKNAADAVVLPVPPLSIGIVPPAQVPETSPLKFPFTAPMLPVSVRAAKVGVDVVSISCAIENCRSLSVIPVPAVYVVSVDPI